MISVTEIKGYQHWRLVPKSGNFLHHAEIIRDFFWRGGDFSQNFLYFGGFFPFPLMFPVPD